MRWLATVERDIRRRYRNLDDLIAEGAIALDDVVYVEVAVVARHVRNPGGSRVRSATVDDAVLREEDGPTAELEILPKDWARLEPEVTTGLPLTIQMTGTPDWHHFDVERSWW